MSFEETKQFAEGWACVGADGEEEDPSTIENLEEVLWAVEEEEKRLQAKLESVGRIFGLMAKREALLAQKAEMADPTRVVSSISSRGGALLREEKLRVAIEKDLPKMNRKLKVCRTVSPLSHPTHHCLELPRLAVLCHGTAFATGCTFCCVCTDVCVCSVCMPKSI